jgi:hypothetical protein
MKKFFTLLSIALSSSAFAQNDTLLWENFEMTTFPPAYVNDQTLPPGNTSDTLWYYVDADGLADGSGAATARTASWGLSYPMTDSDTLEFITVAYANSWFNPPGKAQNYMITKSFYCSNDAVLSWYSAPRQTPRYLDGYKVLISTTNNDLFSFNDTVFVAAEYTAFNGGDSSLFANYSFEPANAFTHGLDGSYLAFDAGDNDYSRIRGKLQKHSVNLAQYAGTTVFIAFFHDSYDDNIITLDNILVTGTFIDNTSVNQNGKNSGNLFVWPNPTASDVNVKLDKISASEISVSVMDITGRTVKSFLSGSSYSAGQALNVNVSELPAGVYNVCVIADGNKFIQKLIKQ